MNTMFEDHFDSECVITCLKNISTNRSISPEEALSVFSISIISHCEQLKNNFKEAEHRHNGAVDTRNILFHNIVNIPPSLIWSISLIAEAVEKCNITPFVDTYYDTDDMQFCCNRNVWRRERLESTINSCMKLDYIPININGRIKQGDIVMNCIEDHCVLCEKLIVISQYRCVRIMIMKCDNISCYFDITYFSGVVYVLLVIKYNNNNISPKHSTRVKSNCVVIPKTSVMYYQSKIKLALLSQNKNAYEKMVRMGIFPPREDLSIYKTMSEDELPMNLEIFFNDIFLRENDYNISRLGIENDIIIDDCDNRYVKVDESNTAIKNDDVTMGIVDYFKNKFWSIVDIKRIFNGDTL